MSSNLSIPLRRDNLIPHQREGLGKPRCIINNAPFLFFPPKIDKKGNPAKKRRASTRIAPTIGRIPSFRDRPYGLVCEEIATPPAGSGWARNDKIIEFDIRGEGDPASTGRNP